MATGSRHDAPLKVAVLMGGQSAERDVSMQTGRTVAAELGRRFRVKPVEIRASGAWVVPEGYLSDPLDSDPRRWFQAPERDLVHGVLDLAGAPVDAVFNGLHGPMGEDGTVQGLFRMAGIPLTGPDVAPAAVTMDKRLTKLVLLAEGISTPRFFTLSAREFDSDDTSLHQRIREAAARVPPPWIVKPNQLGSSVGVAVFHNESKLLAGLRPLVSTWPEAARRDLVLVEQLVGGRELTCGVVETGPEPLALPPVEIRPRTAPFFDYEAKYQPGATEEICPAPLTERETDVVRKTALRVHAALRCAPLSRTDMFLGPDGVLRVLEVNTLPGMTATSLIPLSASRAGIELAGLLEDLVHHAIRRSRPFSGAFRQGPAP